MKTIDYYGKCEYCNDISPCHGGVLPDGTEQILCSKDGLFGQAYIYARKINFCPMCGRPLKGADNEQRNG